MPPTQSSINAKECYAQGASEARRMAQEELERMRKQCTKLYDDCLPLKSTGELEVGLKIPEPPDSKITNYFKNPNPPYPGMDAKDRNRIKAAFSRLRRKAFIAASNAYIRLCENLINKNTSSNNTPSDEIKKYTNLYDQFITVDTAGQTPLPSLHPFRESYHSLLNEASGLLQKNEMPADTPSRNIKNAKKDHRYAPYSTPTHETENLSDEPCREYNYQELISEDGSIKGSLENTFGLLEQQAQSSEIQDDETPAQELFRSESETNSIPPQHLDRDPVHSNEYPLGMTFPEQLETQFQMPKKYTEEQKEASEEAKKQKNHRKAVYMAKIREIKKEKLSNITEDCKRLHEKCIDLKNSEQIQLKIPAPPDTTAANYFEKAPLYTNIQTKNIRAGVHEALYRLRRDTLLKMQSLYLALCKKVSNIENIVPKETLSNEIKEYKKLYKQCINGDAVQDTQSVEINGFIKKYQSYLKRNIPQVSSSSTDNVLGKNKITNPKVQNRYAPYSIPTHETEELRKEKSDNLDADPILDQILRELQTTNEAYNLPRILPYPPLPLQQAEDHRDSSSLNEQEFVLESPSFPLIDEVPLDTPNEDTLFPFNEPVSPLLFRPLNSFNTENNFEYAPADLSIGQNHYRLSKNY